MNKIDRIGFVSGQLTVIEKSPLYDRWICRCSCGALETFWTSALIKGNRTCCTQCFEGPRPIYNESLVTSQEARVLLNLIIKQAILDYTHPKPRPVKRSGSSVVPHADEVLTAQLFLFEEEPFLFGDMELTFEDVCDILDMNADYLRRVVETKKKELAVKTKKYRYISWDKKYNKWSAFILINKKQKLIGRFITEEEAYLAQSKANRSLTSTS